MFLTSWTLCQFHFIYFVQIQYCIVHKLKCNQPWGAAYQLFITNRIFIGHCSTSPKLQGYWIFVWNKLRITFRNFAILSCVVWDFAYPRDLFVKTVAYNLYFCWYWIIKPCPSALFHPSRILSSRINWWYLCNNIIIIIIIIAVIINTYIYSYIAFKAYKLQNNSI